MFYKLMIVPAIVPKDRHAIEKLLEAMGYDIFGSGTCTDMSRCDITFDKLERKD